MCRPASGSRQRWSIAWASSAGARVGTSRPVRSSMTTSGLPPTRVATTGSPLAIASSKVSEMPSIEGGKDYHAGSREQGRNVMDLPQEPDVRVELEGRGQGLEVGQAKAVASDL